MIAGASINAITAALQQYGSEELSAAIDSVGDELLSFAGMSLTQILATLADGRPFGVYANNGYGHPSTDPALGDPIPDHPLPDGLEFRDLRLELGEVLVGFDPVGTAVEVEQRDLHASTLHAAPSVGFTG